MTPITTVLIANRGEIAVRVIQTARAMGLKTVAVYSDADADALHVREADTAVHIGASPVGESYLCGDAIIAAAKASGADAIHPGYGFLSENAEFALACEDAGVTFIGPPAEAIRVMGDKARAKRAMLEAGVPCVPGYQGEQQTTERLVAEAIAVGLPVMVKAAAGGGGRGMRLVFEEDALAAAIDLAQAEAESAFGSRELIIEKAILRPRHVEIQVFADQHGHCVHLGERDCSVQRRHQKVVEESPCPVMTPALRAAMGEAAIEAARAVNYVGAGTVEFLLDEAGQFYFLEMNTRLQVEHPVTELVTGFDLVEWQLRVARGEALPAEQEDIEILGHAIEVRLYAEDPTTGFLPATGDVDLFVIPDALGIRVDSAIETGDTVSPFYDAMVAKVIAYGETRLDALTRLRTALQQTALLGVANNRDFLIDLLDQGVFRAGQATTALISETYGEQYIAVAVSEQILAAAAVIQHALDRDEMMSSALAVNSELLDWSSLGPPSYQRRYCVDGVEYAVTLTALGDEQFAVSVGDRQIPVRVFALLEDGVDLDIDGCRQRILFHARDTQNIALADSQRTVLLTDLNRVPPDAGVAVGGGIVVAPMHGLLVSLDVTVGDAVVAGQRLGILEAMKMQHEILAEVSGTVVRRLESTGLQIAAGDFIIEVEESLEPED